jgi:hypothetical protein
MKIEVDSVTYVVTDNEDETFGVVGGGLSLVIQPLLNDMGLVWGLVSGVADLDLIAKIGESIEREEM